METISNEQIDQKAINAQVAQAFGIEPAQDRIVIKPLEAETKSAGGIIIPDTAQEKPSKGLIIAVGPGFSDRPMEYKAGECVMYSKYSGTEIRWAGEDYLTMRAADVIGRIQPEKDVVGTKPEDSAVEL